MATLDSDDLDAIAGLIEAVITTGDMEGIRHRLGLDGAATAPTTPGAKLGDLDLTQMKIDSSAVVGKIPLRLISDDGTSFEFVDTFHGQSMSWSAEENALVVGNILANLLGKVLGQGSGVITGVGVQADASSASTNAIRDGLATEAKQDEILEAIGDIEGGGGVAINVLPAVGISADRSPGVTLKAFVGETISQSITLYETDNTTPIVLTGKTLVIVFETRQGVDVATVANSNITVGGDNDNVVTFAYPAAATSQERVLKFALRDASAPNTVYLQGLLSVQRAPKVD
jgi:hypothetical protein